MKGKRPKGKKVEAVVEIHEIWVRKDGKIIQWQAIGKEVPKVVGEWPEAEAPVFFAPTVERFERERLRFT
ncbi:MAG TPA: hypothetical protein VKQ11_00565 [Candidatus Sulfotelmatobacter sp.]|nr:hypothetical protein [Candidatus Sulfotelmatobacter sp.]